MSTTTINLDARTFNKSVRRTIANDFKKIRFSKKIGKTVAFYNSDKKVVGFWEANLLNGSKIVLNSWY